jgi:hypothetical protein
MKGFTPDMLVQQLPAFRVPVFRVPRCIPRFVPRFPVPAFKDNLQITVNTIN